MNEEVSHYKNIFERIKHYDEEHNVYWCARELMVALEYNSWYRFTNVLERAKKDCKKSGEDLERHFIRFGKMVEVDSISYKRILDYKLSKYACHLIVQYADSRKEGVLIGRAYFS